MRRLPRSTICSPHNNRRPRPHQLDYRPAIRTASLIPLLLVACSPTASNDLATLQRQTQDLTRRIESLESQLAHIAGNTTHNAATPWEAVQASLDTRSRGALWLRHANQQLWDMRNARIAASMHLHEVATLPDGTTVVKWDRIIDGKRRRKISRVTQSPQSDRYSVDPTWELQDIQDPEVRTQLQLWESGW